MRTRTSGKTHFVTVRGAEQKMREQKKLTVGVRETHFCSIQKFACLFLRFAAVGVKQMSM